MISAFGIDHGEEVSKAFGIGAITKPVQAVGRALQGAGKSTQQSAVRGAFGSKPPGSSIGRKAVGGLRSGQFAAGSAMRNTGKFIKKNPMAATGIAGGGAVGTAGVGYGIHRSRQY